MKLLNHDPGNTLRVVMVAALIVIGLAVFGLIAVASVTLPIEGDAEVGLSTGFFW